VANKYIEAKGATIKKKNFLISLK